MAWETNTNRRRHAAQWVLILFVLAAAVRVGWVAGRYKDAARSESLTYPDEEAYCLSARSLAAGEGLRDEFGYRATYMPAYPAFLAIFSGLDRPLRWARIVQALLAAWVAPATFLAARQWDRWSAGGRARTSMAMPVLAGLAAAVDPFLIFFSGLLLTEALFAAVAMTAWGFVMSITQGAHLSGGRSAHPTPPLDKGGQGGVLQANGCASIEEPPLAPPWQGGKGEGPDMPNATSARRWTVCAVAAGALLWLAVMLRPSAAILVAVTAVRIALGRGSRAMRLTAAAIVALVVVAGLLPWAARNRAVIGEWRWLTTRGGISLYDGVQPGAAGGSDLAHTKTMPEAKRLSEVEWDRFFQEQAWGEARQHPGRVAALAWHKLLRTWSLTPNVEAYRQGKAAWISAAWMVLLLVTAAVGLWSRRKAFAAWATLLLPVIVFTLIHTVFVGSVRYRVPTMPLVMILSAAGVCRYLPFSRDPKGSAFPPQTGVTR